MEGGRGGCQEEEASNALHTDKALDVATSAGTLGGKRSGAHLRGLSPARSQSWGRGKFDRSQL